MLIQRIIIVRSVIDEDIEKQGTYINKIEIISFDEIKELIDTIIITNESFYEDIIEQVEDYNKDIKILDLDTYLRFEILENDF